MGASDFQPAHDPLANTVLLRQSEVVKIVGLSRQSIYKRRKAGTFPQPVDMGGGRIRYRLADIEAWADQLPQVKPVGGPTA